MDSAELNGTKSYINPEKYNNIVEDAYSIVRSSGFNSEAARVMTEQAYEIRP